jgi:hypothetical protein
MMDERGVCGHGPLGTLSTLNEGKEGAVSIE